MTQTSLSPNFAHFKKGAERVLRHTFSKDRGLMILWILQMFSLVFSQIFHDLSDRKLSNIKFSMWRHFQCPQPPHQRLCSHFDRRGFEKNVKWEKFNQICFIWFYLKHFCLICAYLIYLQVLFTQCRLKVCEFETQFAHKK